MILNLNKDEDAGEPDEDQDSEFDIYGQEEDKKIYFQISIYDPELRLFINWSPMTMNVIEMNLTDKQIQLPKIESEIKKIVSIRLPYFYSFTLQISNLNLDDMHRIQQPKKSRSPIFAKEKFPCPLHPKSAKLPSI